MITPPSPASITVSPSSVLLRIGEARSLSAIVLDAQARPLVGQRVTWSSSDPAVATVGISGLVTGVTPGRVAITAQSGSASSDVAVDVERVRVARLLQTSSIAELLTGGATALRVTPLDAAGGVAAGWPAVWTSDDVHVATIDAGGEVRAIAAGETTVRVRVDTTNATFAVRVFGTLDVSLSGLSFAQVVQNPLGTVPMLRGGGLPVVVNVFAQAPAAVSLRADIHVDCTDNGVSRWSGSARLDGPLPQAASAGTPAAQFQMPNAALSHLLQCVAVLDPLGELPDTERANNRYPLSGTVAVNAIDVPALEIAFVPIVLAADGGTIGNVTKANIEEYLVTARQILPLARINARVGAPYTTTTALGNGTDVAWRAILRELETKRVLDGFRGHYYGALRPRVGVASVQYSGFGFISGWTALSIQVGWFNRESAARETVAHELGHNFGRPHAPCGGPANPDPSYPYLDAGIGTFGWDVFTVRTNPAQRALAVTPDTKDLMSYCRPIWISDYNYLKMINGRQLLDGTVAGKVGRVLLVRGEYDARGVRLDPLFEVEAGATVPSAHGVDIELIDGGGTIVGRSRVPELVPDHGSTRSFVATLPLPVVANAVMQLRISTPAGQRFHSALGRRSGTATIAVTRDADRARVRWDARSARHALIRDEVSGEVLAIAAGGVVDLPGASRRRISVSLSDGVGRTFAPARR